MKLEITETGVFDGKGEELAVGTVISIKAEETPGWLVGKSRVIATSPGKGATLTVNPSEGAGNDTVTGGAA